MIRIRYHVAPSHIPGAGRGFFADQEVEPGRILAAPEGDHELVSMAELLSMPEEDPRVRATVRWFEDCVAVAPTNAADFLINHSFAPNALWHLGFVFALRRIEKGEEITLDYRHLLGEGCDPGFRDATTGRAIVGLSWRQAMADSVAALAGIFGGPLG